MEKPVPYARHCIDNVRTTGVRTQLLVTHPS